jgi:hypothetical protein
VAAGYDDSCPACKQATAGAERVGCARCGAYLHPGCWAATKGCGSCGGVETLEEHGKRVAGDRRRRDRRSMIAAGVGGVFVILAISATLVGTVVWYHLHPSGRALDPKDVDDSLLLWVPLRLARSPVLVASLFFGMSSAVTTLVTGVRRPR